MILGRGWIEENGVCINVPNRHLVWPKEQSQNKKIAEKLNVPVPLRILQRPKATAAQQKDIDRRDKLFEIKNAKKEPEWKKIVLFPESSPGNQPIRSSPQKVRFKHSPKSTESIDRRESLAKMKRALKPLNKDIEPKIL
jgi:hypothetical protein